MSAGQEIVAIISAFLGSGIANMLINQYFAKKAKLTETETNISNGVQCLLRDRLLTLCSEYEKDGWCDQTKKTNLQKMYNAYSALGGNDVAHSEYTKVMELRSIEKENEND